MQPSPRLTRPRVHIIPIQIPKPIHPHNSIPNLHGGAANQLVNAIVLFFTNDGYSMRSDNTTSPTAATCPLIDHCAALVHDKDQRARAWLSLL